MQLHKTIMTICSAAVLSFGLAACGGGGGDDTAGTPPPPPPPTTYTVALPDGHGLMAGTTMLAHGDTVVGDTTISCPSANGCALTVSRDPVTGAYTATATGGQVMVAVAEPPPPPPGPDPVQLAAAQDAAKAAWRAARATLAGLAGKESANPAAYQRAVDAVADARAAYDAALAAMTVAAAEEARDDADAANEMAMAQAAAVIAAYDKPRIDAARTAAMDAANEAKMAYEAAKAALAAVESIKGIDMASYDMAVAKVAAAKDAYDAAMAASDAAAAAALLADVQAQRDAARTASDNAATANTDAMKYAGMVQTAEDSALSAAKSDAQTAYDAAKSAYEAAAMRVAALEAVNDDGRAKKDDNVADHVRATDALARTKAAYDDAKAANDMAQAATLSTTARGHADDVETHKGTVDTEKAGVDMYAGLVEAAYTAAQNQRNTEEENRLAEEQRVKDVAAARGRALQSYMDADGDATKAEQAADDAEETASGSAGAIAARSAATAARMAANAAKAAHDAITDEMTKEQADAKASDANTAAGTANSRYMAAKTQNDAIQTAHMIAQETQRVAGVTAAKNAANKAVEAAKTAMDNAAKAATAAETARDNAEDDYEKAMAARTNSAKAKEEYEKAKTAAAAARELADDAEEAYMAAKMAAEGIDDAGTVAAAETAQGTAETERDKAVMAATTAGDHKTTAETAEEDALKYASSHTLGLLMAANAQSETDADKRTAAIKAVATAIGNAAMSTATADNDNDSSTAVGTGGSTTAAAATWPAVPDDENTADTDESAGNVLTITVTRTSGTDLVFRTMAAEADDAATADVDETIVTATKIDGLPGFMHGYSISDRGTHAIVFTDRVQDDAPVAQADVVTAQSLTNAETGTTNTVTDLGTKSGNMYTGVTFYLGTDTADSRTAFTGTLTCPDGAACSIETTVVADGPDTYAVTGYVFTGSREAKAAVTARTAAEQAAAANYLAFGVWLDPDDSAGNDGTGAPQVAAFAGGGPTFATPATLTGSATYNGAATGVYTAGTSVDYFQADAMLTANFGTPGTDTDPDAADDELGTITGRIDGIVAGGTAMDDVILLNSGTITATGGFSGAARMGDATVKDDAATYPYNGHWGGQFYGPAAAAGATGVDTLPPAASGTFGVTGTEGEGDDAVTRSYVGAFGARR